MKRTVRQAALQRLAHGSRCHHQNARGISGRLLHTKSKDASEALGMRAKLPDAETATPLRKSPTGVTINDILERRAKAGKLVAGTAAASDSDMFKGPVCGCSPSPALYHPVSS